MVEELKEQSLPYYYRHQVLYRMPTGNERRKKLEEILSDNAKILVNAHHTRQIRLDKDMQQMIKNGTHEVISIHESRTHKKQYLVKKVSK